MNLLIVSHRRSGTHLTIDSITNNFKGFNPEPLNLDRLDPNHSLYLSLEAFKKALSDNNRVIKTHLTPKREVWMSEDIWRFIENLFNQTNRIHVVRDFFDTMVSLYHYQQSFSKKIAKIKTVREFILMTDSKGISRDLYWARHMNSWLSFRSEVPNLAIKYENWHDNFPETLGHVANLITSQRNKTLVDTRLSQNKGIRKLLSILLFRSTKLTYVSPRLGKKDYFNDYFDQSIKDAISEEVFHVMDKVHYKMEYFDTKDKFYTN